MQLVLPIAEHATNVRRGVMTNYQEPVHVLLVDLANIKSMVLGIRIPAKNVWQVVTTVNLE